MSDTTTNGKAPATLHRKTEAWGGYVAGEESPHSVRADEMTGVGYEAEASRVPDSAHGSKIPADEMTGICMGEDSPTVLSGAAAIPSAARSGSRRR